MAIDDLTKSILDEGELQATKIADDAEKKRALIESQALEARNMVKKEFEQETSKILADAERRVISTATHEAKIALDKERRLALESVFTDAYTKLVALPDAEYAKVITASLEKLPKDVAGTLYTAKSREDITKTLVQKAGLKLSVAPSKDIDGGFIIAGDDFEYNATFKKAIADKKSELEITTANILFS